MKRNTRKSSSSRNDQIVCRYNISLEMGEVGVGERPIHHSLVCGSFFLKEVCVQCVMHLKGENTKWKVLCAVLDFLCLSVLRQTFKLRQFLQMYSGCGIDQFIVILL